jgi:hypothetical protein
MQEEVESLKSSMSLDAVLQPHQSNDVILEYQADLGVRKLGKITKFK